MKALHVAMKWLSSELLRSVFLASTECADKLINDNWSYREKLQINSFYGGLTLGTRLYFALSRRELKGGFTEMYLPSRVS
jgi:hypothetical protein